MAPAPAYREPLSLRWQHGTPSYFEHWITPPPAARAGLALLPHSFVSLTADPRYALLHKGAHGGLCTAQLQPHARVLDLRMPSAASRQLWQLVRASPLGAQHAELDTAEDWLQACVRGSVLRYTFHHDAWEQRHHLRHGRIARSASAHPLARLRARLKLQNFTRHWIEQVIGPARTLGFDAVICNEWERSLGAHSSTQLFVFDAASLTPPHWLLRPHDPGGEATAQLHPGQSGLPR